MADGRRLRDEIVSVMRLHPHTFVYFCEPVTVESVGGPVRDYAIGAYNYMLDVHVFMMGRDPKGRIYATYGSIRKAYWHGFDIESAYDIEFGQAYTEVLRFVRCSFAEVMSQDGAGVSDSKY